MKIIYPSEDEKIRNLEKQKIIIEIDKKSWNNKWRIFKYTNFLEKSIYSLSNKKRFGKRGSIDKNTN